MDRTVPTGAAYLLTFISDTETGNSAPQCYEVIFGHNQGKLPKPLTQMTLAEVQVAQKAWSKRFGSSASGAYQFMHATLKGLIAELALSGSQKLDGDLQDRLGFHLLKRRGYESYIAGKIDITEFGKRLAQEWASFPVLSDCQGAHRKLKRGQSYYAGDGLNKALVKPEKVETILKRVKELSKITIIDTSPALPAENGTVTKLPHVPTDQPVKNRGWAWLIDIITAIFWRKR
jgi:muramidase (phage lysozyme)